MLMIRHNGKDYSTIVDAAKELGVSQKAIRGYIDSGIIPEPPEFDYGVRRVAYYPPEYMKKAKAELERHRRESALNRKRNR